MTQAQIVAAIGRSQPEVSRLLRFHGITSSAMRLRLRTGRDHQTGQGRWRSNGGVFGSVASGRDHEQSDIDLLFTMPRPPNPSEVDLEVAPEASSDRGIR